MNILFYSQRCPTCHNLISVLKNTDLLKYFHLSCVDDKLNNLPPHVTTVPTMIVKNYRKPIVATETFEWVKQAKFIMQQARLDKTNKDQSLNHIINGVKGYSDIEMSELSDKFSLTTNESPALAQSYFGYKDESKNTIFTAPLQNEKLKEDDHKKVISDLEKKRESQDTQYQDTAKKLQAVAIVEADQKRSLKTFKNMVGNSSQQVHQAQYIQQHMQNTQTMPQQQMPQQQMPQQQMPQQQMSQYNQMHPNTQRPHINQAQYTQPMHIKTEQQSQATRPINIRNEQSQQYNNSKNQYTQHQLSQIQQMNKLMQ